MTKEDFNSIEEIVRTLCEATSDTPCGCDACPYIDQYDEDNGCWVYNELARIKENL